MKRIIAMILCLILLVALASCGAQGGDKETKGTEEQSAAPTAPATEEATESEIETEPVEDFDLEAKVDEFLDKYVCVTHGKLDLMFNYAGASFTFENLTNLIRKSAGLPDSCTVEIDEAAYDEFLENYQASGDGGGGTGNGFYWPDPVNVTFSNPAKGETVEREISFSFRKCLPSSEIYPEGVLGTCPEDGNVNLQAAYPKLNTVAISEEVPAYDGFEGEYTAEAVEAFFRDLTGLTDEDAYEFTLIGFDPAAKGEPFFALFSDKNALEGTFDPVWVETAFN